MKIRCLKRTVKYFFQRSMRGWDDSETWSLDHTFALWIVPRLEVLKKNKHGVPISCFNGSTADYTDEEYAEARKIWNKIIDGMIQGFTTKIHQWDDNDDAWYTPEGPPEYNLAKELFAKYLDDLWD